jgi:flagellar basal-body rod protein FlgB
MFGNSTIPMLEQVVQFTQARHGVLAGNLANMDTPGYRTADLSTERFQAKLREAIEARDNRGIRARNERYAGITSSSSSPFAEADFDEFGEVKETMQSILHHDNSNVSLEKQVTELAKNQADHNLAITLLTSQMRLLQTAISERVA